MDIIQAVVYGIVQGIGEFLPISSTAHLILLPKVFGWNDPGPVFDVALHLGTAAAVILFFWNDWVRLVTSGLTRRNSPDGKLFWLLVLATIPAGITGVALNNLTDRLRDPVLIGISLIIMGIILYTADKVGRSNVDLKQVGVKRSLIIGVSQAFAMIPGVSRSGVTMSAGRALGMTRESIARFTFLMSAPIILADGLYHMKKLGDVTIDKLPFAVAVLTSAVVGALSIKFLLNYLRTKGFGIFAVYRIILGLVAIFFLR